MYIQTYIIQITGPLALLRTTCTCNKIYIRVYVYTHHKNINSNEYVCVPVFIFFFFFFFDHQKGLVVVSLGLGVGGWVLLFRVTGGGVDHEKQKTYGVCHEVCGREGCLQVSTLQQGVGEACHAGV